MVVDVDAYAIGQLGDTVGQPGAAGRRVAHVEERARPYLEALCTRYFRLDLEGAERVPEEGRALLVANLEKHFAGEPLISAVV